MCALDAAKQDDYQTSGLVVITTPLAAQTTYTPMARSSKPGPHLRTAGKAADDNVAAALALRQRDDAAQLRCCRPLQRQPRLLFVPLVQLRSLHGGDAIWGITAAPPLSVGVRNASRFLAVGSWWMQLSTARYSWCMATVKAHLAIAKDAAADGHRAQRKRVRQVLHRKHWLQTSRHCQLQASRHRCHQCGTNKPAQVTSLGSCLYTIKLGS